ncbi:PRC-barrel domain-containing protein [Mesorhizobium japonicum]|uniref:Mlr9581 protein n=1 Tax=Mesorhizobium japonicum (strain LMG 29417 / CECT 9101 / MAFF 303099) TaxID=266835 RepID=Q98P77_RHILO|nr:mlr9581 [Mesorhizobium japonicum MAFF 303099]
MLDTRSQSKKPPGENIMKLARIAAPLALFCALGVEPAFAVCNISDAKLEEAVLKSPELRKPENRYLVRDLRTLRDAAFVLWTYGLHDDCERVLANIRQLIAAPSMAKLGGNDEDLADEQLAAGEPQQHQGGEVQGNRDAPDARPLINLDDLGPGLRVDEIVGSEVRSSDDKIVGEVRNVVIGTKDRWDYAVVASGGFFIAGKDSIVVPLRYLQVNEERNSFYLRISSADVKAVPLMPDQEYLWLADEAWRAKNDAIFQKLIPDSVR